MEQLVALAEMIRNVRKELGYQSARKFFYEILNNKTQLDISYTYYMKIEGGRVLPSAMIVNTLVGIIPEPQSSELILRYCQILFPKKSFLFVGKDFKSKHHQKKITSKPKKVTSPHVTNVRQKLLTELQIHVISLSDIHYYLFLILTLARHPVSAKELHNVFGVYNLSQQLADLEKAKIIRKDSESSYLSISNEMKFPPISNEKLKKMYKKIDEWNLKFNSRFSFEPNLEKMLIRRISPRYFSIIINQFNNLIDIIKASEEVSPDYNSDVIMLNFILSKGHFPG